MVDAVSDTDSAEESLSIRSKSPHISDLSPEPGGKRVGIFGGTFDPIHIGHLAIASAAAHGAGLDKVLFVVAHSPWQKEGTREITPSEVRFEMVRAATTARTDFVASDIEILRGGSSYTIDTVSELKEQSPLDEFVLVVGTDVVASLDTWHRNQDLLHMCSLAIIDRPGHIGAMPPPRWRYKRIDAPSLDLSSSMLRRRFREGKPIDYLVPAVSLGIWARWRSDWQTPDDDSLWER